MIFNGQDHILHLLIGLTIASVPNCSPKAQWNNYANINIIMLSELPFTTF